MTRVDLHASISQAVSLQCLVLALLVSVLVGACPMLAGAADPAPVDEILALTGVKRQIEQLDAHLAMHRKNSFKDLAPETKGRLDAIYEAAFDPKIILADVRNTLGQDLDVKKAALVMAFLRSPVAGAAMQAEVDAGAADAEPEFRAFALRLRSKRPDPERVALLRRLDPAVRQSEWSLAFRMSSLRSLAAIGNVVLQPQRRRTADQLDRRLRAMRGQLERAAKDTVLARGLFVYRHVSDDDLHAYIEFYESEMGGWLMDLLSRAMLGAIERGAATAVARALQEAAREDRERPCVGLPCRPPP